MNICVLDLEYEFKKKLQNKNFKKINKKVIFIILPSYKDYHNPYIFITQELS